MSIVTRIPKMKTFVFSRHIPILQKNTYKYEKYVLIKHKFKACCIGHNLLKKINETGFPLFKLKWNPYSAELNLFLPFTRAGDTIWKYRILSVVMVKHGFFVKNDYCSQFGVEGNAHQRHWSLLNYI